MLDDVKSGDLIAVCGKSPGSLAIQLGTLSLPNVGPLGRWGWAGVSHVGIAVPVFGEQLVYESISGGRPRCVRTGRDDPAGVQAHYLADIVDGGGDVWHYPLRCPLYPHQEDRLLQAAESALGRGYDFFGAGRSGGGLLMRLIQRLKGRESMNTVFCAELVLWCWIMTGIAQNKHAGMNPNWLVRWALAKGIVQRGRLLS